MHLYQELNCVTVFFDVSLKSAFMEINPRTIMIMNARDCDSLNIRLRRSTKLVYKEKRKVYTGQKSNNPTVG